MLITANAFSPLAIFDEKIIVMVNIDATKTAKISMEKNPKAELIMKNQKEIPIETVIDLNREELVSN